MNNKILVADDSKTIQKVVSISLGERSYQLIECTDVAQLSEKVESSSPNMVLLDFNLSEDKTGYDLCRDIKSVHPDVQVVFLFGTFDTVDEDLVFESGAANWILKPFDGNKFVNLIDALMLKEEELEDSKNFEPKSSEPKNSDNDEWVMDVPAPIEPATAKTTLEDAVGDWGIEIPGVIGAESDLPTETSIEIPDIIQSNLYPETMDLEYPSELTTPDVANDISLKDHLEDEQDLLWGDNAKSADLATVEDEIPIQKVSNEMLIQESVEAPGPAVQEIDYDHIIDEVTQRVSIKLEDMVKSFFKDKADEVAWEVIPEFAEKAIKQEIQNLSKSVTQRS